MNAKDVMTVDVVSVRPDTPTREIAERLVERGISAAPVVDDRGVPIGMVSEGDLIRFGATAREQRRDWWLTLLAEGTELNPAFLQEIKASERTARDVMSTPVIAVQEDTDVGEISRLLSAHRIKRVPVLRDGRMVGIVSRANLLGALSALAPAAGSTARGGVGRVLHGLESRLEALRRPPAAAGAPAQAAPPDDSQLAADDFRDLMADFEHQEDAHRRAQRQAEREQRKRRIEALIDQHISDAEWRTLMHRARRAAEHGEQEFPMLRFPSQACSDGGRAVNISEADWPATLRGEAAEIYRRWQRDLQPRGFHLTARVLEFPDGMPGDIGLFLHWGT
jgi:CBS domain-containing protein